MFFGVLFLQLRFVLLNKCVLRGVDTAREEVSDRVRSLLK